MSERVGENLNRALHALLAANERAFVLGEDIADPYGGAFRITRGLSSAYPDRVLSTPLSENAVVGVAGGLALCGDTVVVEIMFGDFVGLAFDQILNFATKSVTMYGTRVPMRMVVRCPVGGGRGYGATHSQSVQKHFIGVPNLTLYELSPFHDAAGVLADAVARENPCLLFEDKVLYSRRMFRDGVVDDRFRYEPRGDLARVHAPGAPGRPTLLIAPGGMAHRAVEAAHALLDQGRAVEVLVPSRLYPVPVEDLLAHLDAAEDVWVVEEGTAGGTWGSEVATRLYETAWHRLRGPVRLIHSADSVIPAAPHLEREVLVRSETIRDRLLTGGVGSEHPVRIPTLNTNDASYVLVEWLAEDGARVAADDPVAVVETSKATEELPAGRAGLLRHTLPAGADCEPGATIATVTVPAPGGTVPLTAAVPAPGGAAAVPVTAVPLSAPVSRAAAPIRAGRSGERDHPPAADRLPPHQRRVADLVSAAHRDIPAAFTAIRVDLDPALAAARLLTERTGAAVALPELLVRAAAVLHATHPGIFATLTPEGRYRTAPAPVIGVTVDVGTGLYTPVLRDADRLPVDDLADALAALRMKALRGALTENDLAGMNLLVALNNAPGVIHAQPIIPPGVACALSLPDTHEEVVLTAEGTPRTRRVADLGLAYDHRLVNGAAAAAFLDDLRRTLHDPDPVTRTPS